METKWSKKRQKKSWESDLKFLNAANMLEPENLDFYVSVSFIHTDAHILSFTILKENSVARIYQW